jgi:hypothetical protein
MFILGFGTEFLISSLIALFTTSVAFTWQASRVLEGIRDRLEQLHYDHVETRNRIQYLHKQNRLKILLNAEAIAGLTQQINLLYQDLNSAGVKVRPPIISFARVFVTDPGNNADPDPDPDPGEDE